MSNNGPDFKIFTEKWENAKDQIRDKLDIDTAWIPSIGLGTDLIVKRMLENANMEELKEKAFLETVAMSDCADADTLYLCFQRMADLCQVLNYGPAGVWLGIFCEEILEKYKDAQYWYNKAAGFGNGMGMYRVGLLYLNKKVPLPPETSIERCFTDAAAHGVPEARLKKNGGFKKNDPSYNVADPVSECSVTGFSSLPPLPPLSPKKLYSYNALEPIEFLNRSSSPFASSIQTPYFAETPEYYVYSYSRESEYASCFFRQSKKQLDEIVFLCSFNCDPKNTCCFHGKLFFVGLKGYGGNGLYSVDISTGEKTLHDWFSHKDYSITAAMVMHTYCQDKIESLRLDNGKLFVTVYRVKSDVQDDDPLDVTMYYTLCVSVVNGKYTKVYSFTDIDTSLLKEISSDPRNKWHVATSEGLYFLIDKDKRVAKTHNGTILSTKNLDIAQKMANDMERYGDNAPEMSFLSLHMNLCESFKFLQRKETVELITSYFAKIDDWTYLIKPDTENWDKLFGSENERKRAIRSWLPKPALMQMNVVFTLGKKYKSLNLPFILAMIIENTDPLRRDRIFNLLMTYINSSGYARLVRDDIDVFASYYEILFNMKGTTTNSVAQDIDFDALINEHRQPLSKLQSVSQYDPRYCRFCGKLIPSDSVFCPSCGKRLN